MDARPCLPSSKVCHGKQGITPAPRRAGGRGHGRGDTGEWVPLSRRLVWVDLWCRVQKKRLGMDGDLGYHNPGLSYAHPLWKLDRYLHK